MKVKELFEDAIVDMTYEAVKAWGVKQINSGRIHYDDRYKVDEKPPYKISAARVKFSKLITIFKKPLPVQFGEVTIYNVAGCRGFVNLSQLNVDRVDTLTVSDNDIVNFENCPSVRELEAQYSYKLVSLKGIHPDVENLSLFASKALTAIDASMPKLRSLRAPATGLETLHDIHINCPNLLTLQINACDIKSNVLGILKLKHLETLIFQTNGNSSNFANDGERALAIVKKFLKNRDLLACQEELLEAGLKQFAKF